MKKKRFNIDWIIQDSLAVGSIPRKEEHIEILKKAIQNTICVET